MLLLALYACAGAKPDDTATETLFEPIDQPADPAENGAPVGERTIQAEGQTIEVWYPTSESQRGSATERADYESFIPDAVTAVLGEITLPDVDSGAIRDAPIRVGTAPYPVVVFSHGFGGMRIQSLDYAVHLASRGYVVVAADHPGRMLGDVLPCVFSPPLEGCDLTGMSGDDPAVEDVADVMTWVFDAAEEGDFAGLLDTSRIALSGHSAGGGTVQTAGSEDDRFSALLSMSAGAEPTRDVPLLLMEGTCDGIIPDSAVVAAQAATPGSQLVEITGAGHLAFSDLCELDMKAFADEFLSTRDDVNSMILGQLVALASDGCADGTPVPESCGDSFLPTATSDPIIRAYTTLYFDQVLKGEGSGVQAGLYPEAVVTGL